MSRAEGTWGEAQVANFLRRRGYQFLAHSYHCRFGEVDLIARQGSVLCLEARITAIVRGIAPEKLRRTAACYLAARGLDCPVRFDVAEVYTDTAHSAAATRIEYLEDAF